MHKEYDTDEKWEGTSWEAPPFVLTIWQCDRIVGESIHTEHPLLYEHGIYYYEEGSYAVIYYSDGIIV